MSATKVSVLIIFLALVSISCLTQQVVSQLTTVRPQLPDRDTMNRYIANLIDSYNVLVNEYDKPRPDFNIIKAYFSLYHEAGNSFRVIVIQTDPYQAQWTSLIFIPIREDQPDVIMDYRDTFESLFPNMTVWLGFLTTQKNLSFTYNDTVVRQDLVLGIQASDVSADYMTRSTDAAKTIYQRDRSNIPAVSQTETFTQTTIISQKQPTSIQPSQNNFGYIIFGAISAAILVGIAIVVTYFGSGKDFVKFLVDKGEQKGVIGDLKQLFRLLLGRNKKTNEQNVSEIETSKPEGMKSRLPPNADEIITLLNPFLVRWQAKEILGMKASRWLGVDTEDRIDLQKSARSLSDKLLQLEASYHDIWDWGLMNQIQYISEELRKFGITQPVVSQNDLDFTQLELHGRSAFEAARAIVGWLKQMKNEP